MIYKSLSSWFYFRNHKIYLHFLLILPLEIISMGLCKKDVTPVLTHWSYVFLVLTHRSGVITWNSCSSVWYKTTVVSSVGNSHRSTGLRPTTLEEDRELFVDFSLILCLWIEISRHEDLQLFLTEFQTLVGSQNFGHQQWWSFVYGLPKLVANVISQFQYLVNTVVTASSLV